MTREKSKYLFYLSELKDYKIADKDPDVRGWVLKDAENRNIGKIKNLLVNKDLERVVYLDVEVDQSIIDANHDPYGTSANPEIKEFINEDGENHIIIPIGLVNISRDPDYVYTDSINYQTFAETKRIRRGAPIHRDYEEVVLKSYNRNLKTTDEPYIIEDEEDTAYDIEPERRGYVHRYKREERPLSADALDYDQRTNDPDYLEQKAREYETPPDEVYDAEYARKRQKLEEDPDYIPEDELIVEKKLEEKHWDPEEPYKEDYEGKRPEEHISRKPGEDPFYHRREFDDRHFGRKRRT